MVSNIAELYCTVQQFKIAANINSTLSKYDAKITDIVLEAHNFVNDALTPYANTLPIPAGDHNYRDAVDVAKYYALTQWFIFLHQPEREKSNRENYMARLESIIKSMRAESQDRTIDTASSVNVKNQRILLPSEKYTAILGGSR